MSKFVRIQTELRDLALIKRALDDLALSYQENQRYTHVWSGCLLYTSPSPRDRTRYRMPSSA